MKHPAQRALNVATTPLLLLLLLLAHGEMASAPARPQTGGVPVVDDLVITSNTKLTPGVYHVKDLKEDGVIKIEADNITLDGTGVTIVGEGFRGYGIVSNGHTGLVLRNFNISGFNYGVRISNSTDVLIEKSSISGNRKDTTTDFLQIALGEVYGGGVLFKHVRHSTVSNNTLTNQSTGVELIDSDRNNVLGNTISSAGGESVQNSCFGVRLESSDENLLRGNIADYVDRVRYGFSSGDSAGFLLSASHHNRIVSNSFTHGGDGFFIGNSCQTASNFNYVYGNDASDSPNNAFECTFSDGNVFDNNIASNSHYGFWLGFSYNTRVTNNVIANNTRYGDGAGIAIDRGHHNEIDRNTITGNPSGIRLWADGTSCPWIACGLVCTSSDYQIHHNTLTQNTALGISIADTPRVVFAHNQVSNNGNRNIQVSGNSPGVNVWRNTLLCQNPAPCHSVYNSTDSSVSAAFDWWGTTNPTAIAGMVFGPVSTDHYLPEATDPSSGTTAPLIREWFKTTPLPQASAGPFNDRGQQLVFYKGRVYVFGGQGAGNTQVREIYSGFLRPDGTVNKWVPAGRLPDRVPGQTFYDHVVVRVGAFVYLITGADGSTAVYYAPLNATNGSVGAWTQTSALAPSRQSFAATAYGKYVYVSGGNSGGTQSFVQFATVQANGSLGPWSPLPPDRGALPQLPEPVQSHSMVVWDGYLYVINPNGHVYFSRLDTNGRVEGWAGTMELPVPPVTVPIANYAAFEYDGHIYMLGGNLAHTYFAPLYEDANVGYHWLTTTKTPEQLNAQRVGAEKGFVYAVGGSADSAFRNTVYYAPLPQLPEGCRGGEVLTAPFTGSLAGGRSLLTYTGRNTVTVSGVGQASAGDYSDAFYVFADGNGNPVTPRHPTEQYNWVLSINGRHAEEFIPGKQVPAYRPDHRYTFKLNAQSGPLTFGVGDVAVDDNTGRYVVGLCGGTP